MIHSSSSSRPCGGRFVPRQTTCGLFVTTTWCHENSKVGKSVKTLYIDCSCPLHHQWSSGRLLPRQSFISTGRAHNKRYNHRKVVVVPTRTCWPKATATSSQISMAQQDLLDYVAPLELGRKALNNSAIKAVVNEKIGTHLAFFRGSTGYCRVYVCVCVYSTFGVDEPYTCSSGLSSTRWQVAFGVHRFR